MFFPPRTEEDSRAYIARALAVQDEQSRQTYELAVTLRNDGRLIGACDLTGEDDGIADVGYSLARDLWGQGYATEIVHALVTAGFGALGLRRIVATVAPENLASARVLEKAGFRPMGVAHRYRYAKGRWWDMAQFALEHAAWDVGREQASQANEGEADST
jgi:ribosomal-protein-alanine N-acetyltransferase